MGITPDRSGIAPVVPYDGVLRPDHLHSDRPCHDNLHDDGLRLEVLHLDSARLDRARLDSVHLDVLHLDMDCFFAAVEVLDDPALAGRPLVVGGIGERGVVCSASYEARAFGVRSAMPTGEARRLCPQAVYVAPRHDRYGEVSRAIQVVLSDVTPLIESIGLDEAFLDVTGSHRLFGTSEQIAVGLRERVASELGLPCSVGVAANKLIAKLASKAAKPTVRGASQEPTGRSGLPPGGALAAPGVVVVPRVDEIAFLNAHSVRALPGVGPRTEERLGRFGVSSVGDLAAVPRESLERLLGAAHGSALHSLAHGSDLREVTPERATRSIGHEETFASDLRDPAELDRRARAMATAVADRCRLAGVEARTVTVKVRFADFSTHTRSRTLTNASAVPSILGDAAAELLLGLGLGRAAGVRMLGIHASLLSEPGSAPEQLELFAGARDGAQAARRQLEELAEPVRARFGAGSIAAASALSRRVELRDDVGRSGVGRSGVESTGAERR